MNKIFLIIILLAFNIGYSQFDFDYIPYGQNSLFDSKYSFEHVHRHNLKIGVKKVLIYDNLTKLANKSRFYEEYHFNKYGLLQKRYYIKKDGSKLLMEEYNYKDSLLIESTEYNYSYRKNDSVFMSKEPRNYFKEKYTHNKNNQILEKKQKTNYDKKYYTNEFCVYKNGRLSESFSINNHVNTEIGLYKSCKGNGSTLRDFHSTYNYNEKGLLSHYERYSNTNRIYKDTIFNIVHPNGKVIKNYISTIPIIRSFNEIDLKNFKSDFEKYYKYNKSNQRIFEKSGNFKMDYTFFGTFLRSELTTYLNDNDKYGREFHYKIINADTLLKKIYGVKKGKNKLTKNLDKKFVWLKNGQLKVKEYENGKLILVLLYDENKNLIKNTSKKYSVIFNYDNRENWVEKKKFYKDSLVEHIKREIEYH